MNFHQRFNQATTRQNSWLCIGIDPDAESFSQTLKAESDPFFAYAKTLIDRTAEHCSAFKFQIAHFAALAAEDSLDKSINYVKQRFPNHLVLLDAKRGDIGSTAEKYAFEAFSRYQSDAVTVNPYVGSQGLKPFFENAENGVIALCKTSNESAQDIQSLILADQQTPLYLHIAKLINEIQNNNGMLVVGATQVEAIKKVRRYCPDIPFLIPGVGAQGGDLKAAVTAAMDCHSGGFLISLSRAVSESDNPRRFAEVINEEINRIRMLDGSTKKV